MSTVRQLNEQRLIDQAEDNQNAAGWGDAVQREHDQHAGDRYERDLMKGWD